MSTFIKIANAHAPFAKINIVPSTTKTWEKGDYFMFDLKTIQNAIPHNQNKWYTFISQFVITKKGKGNYKILHKENQNKTKNVYLKAIPTSDTEPPDYQNVDAYVDFLLKEYDKAISFIKQSESNDSKTNFYKLGETITYRMLVGCIDFVKKFQKPESLEGKDFISIVNDVNDLYDDNAMMQFYNLKELIEGTALKNTYEKIFSTKMPNDKTYSVLLDDVKNNGGLQAYNRLIKTYYSEFYRGCTDMKEKVFKSKISDLKDPVTGEKLQSFKGKSFWNRLSTFRELITRQGVNSIVGSLNNLSSSIKSKPHSLENDLLKVCVYVTEFLFKWVVNPIVKSSYRFVLDKISKSWKNYKNKLENLKGKDIDELIQKCIESINGDKLNAVKKGFIKANKSVNTTLGEFGKREKELFEISDHVFSTTMTALIHYILEKEEDIRNLVDNGFATIDNLKLSYHNTEIGGMTIIQDKAVLYNESLKKYIKLYDEYIKKVELKTNIIFYNSRTKNFNLGNNNNVNDTVTFINAIKHNDQNLTKVLDNTKLVLHSTNLFDKDKLDLDDFYNMCNSAIAFSKNTVVDKISDATITDYTGTCTGFIIVPSNTQSNNPPNKLSNSGGKTFKDDLSDFDFEYYFFGYTVDNAQKYEKDYSDMILKLNNMLDTFDKSQIQKVKINTKPQRDSDLNKIYVIKNINKNLNDSVEYDEYDELYMLLLEAKKPPLDISLNSIRPKMKKVINLVKNSETNDKQHYLDNYVIKHNEFKEISDHLMKMLSNKKYDKYHSLSQYKLLKKGYGNELIKLYSATYGLAEAFYSDWGNSGGGGGNSGGGGGNSGGGGGNNNWDHVYFGNSGGGNNNKKNTKTESFRSFIKRHSKGEF